MAARTGSQRRTALLPEGTVPFLQRRLIEIGGVGLIALAVVLIAALVSFDAADPSFNHVTDAAAANWLGRPGAYLADLVLQSLGLAGGAVALVLAVWGWRLVSHRGLPLIWLHLTLLPLALVTIAGGFAAFSTPDSWPLDAGLGGVVGMLLYAKAGALLGPWSFGLAAPLVGLGALVLSLGLGREEWRAIASALLHMVRGVARVAANGGYLIADAMGRVAGRRASAHEGGGVEKDATPVESKPAPRARRERRQRPKREPELAAETAPRRATPPVAIVEKERKKTKPGKRAEAQRQGMLELDNDERYDLPSLDLLSAVAEDERTEIDDEALAQNARMLESVLSDFGVNGEIIKVRPGPVVTLYELEPAPGIKSSRVIGLADDIARSMSAISARVAVIPGRNAIGIELPNTSRDMVYLRELLASDRYETTASKLPLALGKDIGGEPVMADLARMPHLLVAGTTGSGKSVAINTMILSLLYRHSPDACKFIMIDPKMLELSVYEGIPHLLSPVVTDPNKAVVALKWAVREMEGRYRAMSNLGVRNIAGYNKRIAEAKAHDEQLMRTVQTGFDAETGKPIFEEQPLDMEPMPYIVIIVDEMADLMLVAGKDIEAAIQRLAQMARAAGIHLIMATQRPSVDVITGTIKANFPTRISFQVTSKIDSRTILGEQGAEQLLGQGDMLYMEGGGRITRVHGPFVSDDEVERVVAALKEQGEPAYVEAVTEDPELASSTTAELVAGTAGNGNSGDELYDQAVALVVREQRASTSFVQRHLQIGYNRAARIIERMENEGVVSRADRTGRREVLAPNHEEMDR